MTSVTWPESDAVLMHAADSGFRPRDDPKMTTSERDMYDYSPFEMLEYGNVDSPAFMLHYDGYWGCKKHTSYHWLTDFISRLHWCEETIGVDYVTAVARSHAAVKHMMESRPLLEGCAVLSSVIEVAAGETLTDFEIIDRYGVRRPRPDIVDFYVADAARASEWFWNHMDYVQQTLQLDFDEMEQITLGFELSVTQAIERRDEIAPEFTVNLWAGEDDDDDNTKGIPWTFSDTNEADWVTNETDAATNEADSATNETDSDLTVSYWYDPKTNQIYCIESDSEETGSDTNEVDSDTDETDSATDEVEWYESEATEIDWANSEADDVWADPDADEIVWTDPEDAYLNTYDGGW